MMPIRALVVDDEVHARDSVRALLDAQPRWHVIGECDSATALRDALLHARWTWWSSTSGSRTPTA